MASRSDDGLTLGMQATKIATAKSKEWVDNSMQVIRKTVLDMAEQGLFHCTLRFEDTLPQDVVNQEMLLKVLLEENLKGEFVSVPDRPGVQLHISWGTWQLR